MTHHTQQEARSVHAAQPAFSPAALKSFGYAAQSETEHNIGGVHPHALSQRRCQTGRSMIEMLAVLAIIGILSVVAVAGLMWAFAKHKANDTIHDVHLWELAALDSNQLFDRTSGQLILPELGSVSTHGYPMAIWIESGDAFSVHVNDVPKRVCSLMLDMVTADQIVTVNDVLFESADICDAETNLMIFYLSKDQGAIDQACIPACSGTERCCGGECRTIQTPCGSDGCTDCGSDYCTTSNTCCPTPTATKCGSEDCCEGNCCNNVCCPSDQVCGSDGACACQNNLVMNPTTGLCECPSDTPYYFEDANLCCQSGYTPVDGVCQKIDCRGGPTNYNCYINDKQCGYNCDSLGRNCQLGICYADLCSKEETFKSIPFYVPGNYSYGCAKAKDEQIMCYSIYEDKHQYLCSLSGQNFCCYADNSLTCTSGECDTTCPDGWTYSYYDTNLGVCQKDKYLVCYRENNTWRCLKNHFVCGTGCSDVEPCGTCATDSGCLDGMTINEATGRCENDVLECLSNASENEVISTGGYQICQIKETGEKCGTYNFNKVLVAGACTDPGCPEGMVFGFVLNKGHFGYYGCVDEDIGNQGMACYYNISYQPNECYYNGSLCGQRCDYNGTNCGMVYLPQCAQSGHCPQTGYDMSDGCTCDGNVTTVNGINYCCPTGHTYTNGACALN